jgi:hypothetical protein
MPIQRANLRNDYRYTKIPNDWVRDPRLSLKSIGLLAQLLSHSEGWSVHIASLAKSNGCGIHSIRTAIEELEVAGYLRREQRRNKVGNFSETLWITSDPVTPTSNYSTSENPTSDNPTSENRTLKKNISKKPISKKPNREGTYVHGEGIDWPLLEDRHELV